MTNAFNQIKYRVQGRLFLFAFCLSISACHLHPSQSTQPSPKATPEVTRVDMVRALAAGSTAVPKYGSSGSTLTAPKL